MKTLEYAKPKAEKQPFLTGLAKKQILKSLGQLKEGHLSIEDKEGTFEFGSDLSKLRVSIIVHDPMTYRHFASNGSIGAAEAYILGLWSSPDITSVMRLFSRNLHILDSVDTLRSPLKSIARKLYQLATRNSLAGSRKNISTHYDLGNNFFRLFLSEDMMYSSGIYPNTTSTLEEASEYKLKVLCESLELTADDHLLEIGTGWGGLAIYAAKHYGCRVTTTTISQEQFKYAEEAVKQEGLEGKITLLLEDYRYLQGQYDKLVSVEMIEAVGHEYLEEYFKKCSSLIKDNGLMAIQSITIADQRYEKYRKGTDFIQQYIFPGGCLPSIERMTRCISRSTDMQMINLRDITSDYASTLYDWRKRFNENTDQVAAMNFDERFIRLWNYYLCYCEGGFRERIISTSQITLAKPGYRFSDPL